jgi:putative serine protease PepD
VEASHDRQPRGVRAVWLVIATAVVTAAVVLGAAYLLGWNATPAPVSACNVQKVSDRVLPSVVTIFARGPGGAGTGSGSIIDTSGYILTNNHVISPAANGGSVQVLFSDGTEVQARIAGRDPATDLAVLRVEPPHGLKPIAVGSSAELAIGQPVAALGAPLGLSGTTTSGIVSALDRTVYVPGDNGGRALLVSAVQTDASINPGNSGGALVNCGGQLIGVPTAGATISGSGSIGLGFAIPSDFASAIADEIIKTGRVTHAFFGLVTAPISPAAASQASTAHGLFVTAIQPDGPAARAGVRPGDIITEVDGQPATSSTQLESLTLTRKAGDQVKITFNRGGNTQTTTVTLGSA